MHTIEEEKKKLRIQMTGLRNAFDSSKKIKYDTFICAELASLIKRNNFNVVHSYIPFLSEINIVPLLVKLLEAKITVVCPKTLPKRKLENRKLHSLNQLETGIMGTQHPVESTPFEGAIDLIIVPGLAFDDFNYRLGYGGGYYDNFMKTQLNALKVGIFYPFQKVANVPIETHDVKLDLIIEGRAQ